MVAELPDMNQRVKEVVDRFAKGNVSRFVGFLNEGKSEDDTISQQKFNRIFNIDPRTKKVPTVPSDIVRAITSKYPELNTAWLLTGQGEMLLPNGTNELTDKRSEPMEPEEETELSFYKKSIQDLTESTRMRAQADIINARSTEINARSNEINAKNIEKLIDLLHMKLGLTVLHPPKKQQQQEDENLPFGNRVKQGDINKRREPKEDKEV